MGNVESTGQSQPGVPAEHLASSKPVYPSLGRFTISSLLTGFE